MTLFLPLLKFAAFALKKKVLRAEKKCHSFFFLARNSFLPQNTFFSEDYFLAKKKNTTSKKIRI